MRGKRSNVVLFIHGLPADVSNRELKVFIRGALNSSGLKTKNMFSELVGDCNILRITDPETGQVEFHGLIEIRPTTLAMRAIDILNESEFRGCRLTTHRYRQRSPLDGHRGLLSNPNADRSDAPPKEERRADRKIDLAEAGTPSLASFRMFGSNHRFSGR